MADYPITLEKRKTNDIIVYFGDDIGYWESIKSRYKERFAAKPFDFHRFPARKDDLYQTEFMELLELSPAIIYIDFSVNRDFKMSLAQMISRDNQFRRCALIGLVDKKSDVRVCLSSGMHLIHVKCGEMHDVAYHAMMIRFRKSAGKPQFARAKFNSERLQREVDLKGDFRIGYLTPEGFHAEGNLPLEDGEQIRIESEIPKELVPSPHVILEKSSTADLYYDFHYSYNFKFVFLDPPNLDLENDEAFMGFEGDEMAREALKARLKNTYAEKEERYKDDLKAFKRKYKIWLDDQMTFSSPKRTKVLIVDHEMDFLKALEKPLDKYSFTIRTQTFLNDDPQEVMKIRPNIIAIQYQDVNPFNDPVAEEGEELVIPVIDEVEQQKRDKHHEEHASQFSGLMTNLTACIKKTVDYRPFIVVFNCDRFTSKSFQETFKYPLFLVHKESLALSTVLNLADIFERKQESAYEQKIKDKILALKKEDPHKYRNLKQSDFEEQRLYLKKSSSMSYFFNSIKVNPVTLTESEMEIASEKELELTSYQISFPIKMLLKLIPDESGNAYYKENGKLVYRGLIHGIDEQDKKEVRRQINEVFFEPKKKEREKEEKMKEETEEKFLAKKREEEEKKAAEIAEEQPDETAVKETAPTEEKTEENNPEENDQENSEAENLDKTGES